jgi:hypothetical protein
MTSTRRSRTIKNEAEETPPQRGPNWRGREHAILLAQAKVVARSTEA